MAVVDAAYRARALQFHPDIAGADSTAKMQQVNWARDELRRDLTGWRERVLREQAARQVIRVPSSKATPAQSSNGSVAPSTALGWVQVAPQVLILSGVVGASAYFRASGAQRADSIRVRFRTSSPVEVSRISDDGAGATFAIRITSLPTFTGDDSFVEPVEVNAPGLLPNSVFVSIQPMSSAALSQQYPTERIAPARHASADARVSFGKYKGRTFQEVGLMEPSYLEWMLRDGAGSVVEQECARLALGLPAGLPLPPAGRGQKRLGAKTPKRRRGALPQASASAPEPLPSPLTPPIQAARPVRALPDPTRPTGLLGMIRKLLG